MKMSAINFDTFSTSKSTKTKKKRNLTTEQVEKLFTKYGFEIKSSTSSRVSGKRKLNILGSDRLISMYVYYYEIRTDINYHTQEEINSGDCFVAYLSGETLRNNGIENLELSHKFSPTEKDLEHLVLTAESLILLLLG